MGCHSLNSFISLDAIQRWVLASLLEDGEVSSPRGMVTRELLATGFQLTNPRARAIRNPARGWSAALAIGEFAWHVSASNQVAAIAHYAPRWRDFSEDGAHIRGSCYGRRIFGRSGSSPSQWELLVSLLRADPDSRRAILSVQQDFESSLTPRSLDVPCITTCQFLIREQTVHAVVHMRSNDAIWGLPYDVFLFTMLQEMLAIELGLEMGNYHHFAGSMHLYDRHTDLAKRILATDDGNIDPMPRMGDLDHLGGFLLAEEEIRLTGSSDLALPPYWMKLSLPLRRHAEAASRRAERRDRSDTSPIPALLAV